MRIGRIVTAILVLTLCVASCKTYYIPVESFKQQFAPTDSSGQKEVTSRSPFGGQSSYMTYAADSIYAMDKKGNPVVLVKSPAVEMRITDSANKKTIFYFDLTQFDGENITGRRSRILNIKKTIPIRTVKLIEIQNGGKNYHYTH